MRTLRAETVGQRGAYARPTAQKPLRRRAASPPSNPALIKNAVEGSGTEATGPTVQVTVEPVSVGAKGYSAPLGEPSISTAKSASKPNGSVVANSGENVLSSKEKTNESGKRATDGCSVRFTRKLSVVPNVSACRKELNGLESVSVTGPGISVPDAPPVGLATSKVPLVAKSLMVTVLFTTLSPSRKSKARNAVVPNRDGVSRVKWRTVALAVSGATHKNAARPAAKIEG